MAFSASARREDIAVAQKSADVVTAQRNAATAEKNAITQAGELAVNQQKLPIEKARAAVPYIEQGAKDVQAIGQLAIANNMLSQMKKALDSGNVSYSSETRGWTVRADNLDPGFLKALGSNVNGNAFDLNASLKQALGVASDSYLSSNPNVKASSDTRFNNVMHSLTGGTDYSGNPAALSNSLGKAIDLIDEVKGARKQGFEAVNEQLDKLGMKQYSDPSKSATEKMSKILPGTTIVHNQKDYDRLPSKASYVDENGVPGIKP